MMWPYIIRNFQRRPSSVLPGLMDLGNGKSVCATPDIQVGLERLVYGIRVFQR